MNDIELALEAATELKKRISQRKLYAYQPYPFQEKFHQSGFDNNQVVLIAGNRVGKSQAAAYEVTMHLTGIYPDWWKGRRFNSPVKVWVSGVSNSKTRDVIQTALCGQLHALGTGTIPKDCLVDTVRLPGVPNAYSSMAVRHTRGISYCVFKSYEMGQEAFYGESVDVVWLDEEPPMDVYSQALTRVLDRKGLVLLTFTPENGATELVSNFINHRQAGQAVIHAGWEDAPHLDEAMKKQILAALPPHEREMRSKGVPVLGSGMVWPIAEEQLLIKPFPIPDYWKRIIGIDFGFNHDTAVVWCAFDPETRRFYVYDTYKSNGVNDDRTIPLHALTIKSKFGDRIPVAWPHDGQRHDSGSGEGLAAQFRSAGVKMLPKWATNPPSAGKEEGTGGNSLEVGLQAIYAAMSEERFKVFDTCQDWFQEWRMYHRKNGEVVKLNDDLMAATRYAYMMLRHAKPFAPINTGLNQMPVENYTYIMDA